MQTGGVSGGWISWPFFKGATNEEKRLTLHGPEGCDENGPAAVRQLPDRRPILIATKAMLVTREDTGLILEGALIEE